MIRTYNSQSLRNQAEQELVRLRQMSASTALRTLQALDATRFEYLVALLFEARGYEAKAIGTQAEEGVDILLHRGNAVSIVQCKHGKGSVGQPEIRDLYGTVMHVDADEAFLVTAGTVTLGAREWASGKPIQLVDGYSLTEWIDALNGRYRSRRMEDVNSHGGAPRRWLWPIIIVVLILFGVAIGLALTVFTERMVGEQPIADDQDRATVSSFPETPTAEREEQDRPPAEAVTTGTPSESPTPVSTATPLPPCDRPVDPGVAALHRRNRLGCPTSALKIIWSAWQPFERGYMYWRSDNDTSYYFLGSDNGTWSAVVPPSGDPNASRGQPPAQLQAPVRGFGYIWANEDELFQALGWAKDIEKGFCSATQQFERGFIFQSAPVDSCSDSGHYNQARSADWQPVTVIASLDGNWSSSPESPATNPSSEPLPLADQRTATPSDERSPAAEAQMRPPEHGIFRADRITGLVLDGELSEWENDRWIPFPAVVWGSNSWSGTADLSGSFQVRWSADGLWLAVRIIDDRYRNGPLGTDMWQGDGLEIHLDRELERDFSSAEMNADDYQIGVGFGPNLSAVTAYRWIPYDQEGTVPAFGSGRIVTGGYQVEIQLPWENFGVSQQQRKSGNRFGFNLSVNDNDGASPTQETTISASPARSNHFTPTEWGTLILNE